MLIQGDFFQSPFFNFSKHKGTGRKQGVDNKGNPVLYLKNRGVCRQSEREICSPTLNLMRIMPP